MPSDEKELVVDQLEGEGLSLLSNMQKASLNIAMFLKVQHIDTESAGKYLLNAMTNVVAAANEKEKK